MRGNKDLRPREATSATIIVRLWPRQERMLTAMCDQERRTVADMMRLLIEEGARARGIDMGGSENDTGRVV